MKQCLVLGGYNYSRFINNINSIRKDFIKITEIDPYKVTPKILGQIKNGYYSLIVFTGGADVSPKYYKETKSLFTIVEPKRDEIEKEIYEYAIASNTALLGICRGAQFLSVMQPDGKLLQHVEGHTNTHYIDINPEYLPPNLNKSNIKVTSTHHQMIDLTNMDKEKYVLIGRVKKEQSKIIDQNIGGIFGKTLTKKSTLVDIPFDHPEIVYYIDTKTLVIQGHPEFNNSIKIADNFGELSIYLINTLLLGIDPVNYYDNLQHTIPSEHSNLAYPHPTDGAYMAKGIEEPILLNRKKRYFKTDTGINLIEFDYKHPNNITYNGRGVDNLYKIIVPSLPKVISIQYQILGKIYSDISESIDLLDDIEFYNAIWETYFEAIDDNIINGVSFIGDFNYATADYKANEYYINLVKLELAKHDLDDINIF